MNRRIQIRRRADVIGMTAVYEGAGPYDNLQTLTPDYYLSRIWQGVLPPSDGDPGYTCVLGEVYDPSLRQQERTVRLLDEGVALIPEDFTKAERAYYKIPEDSNRRPTKMRLGQAVIALKDIYWPQMLLLPKGPGSTDRSDIRGSSFTTFIRNLDGLMAYPPQFGTRYFQRWFPLFRTTRRVIEGFAEVQNEDLDYNLALVDSMMDSRLLKVTNHCSIYLEEKLPITRRCVGMILAEMEVNDMTHQMRKWRFSDGYAAPVEDPLLEEEAESFVEDEQAMWRWWAGEESWNKLEGI